MTDSPDTDDADSALGWDAIDMVAVKVYGAQEPQHYGTAISYRLGGNDPLQGISVYRNAGDSGSQPHWHYLTYGFSDLYGEDEEDGDDAGDSNEDRRSGYGFELTFRLPIEGAETTPPTWPLNFLQNIARYVFQSGNVFAAGHWMTANGPIKAGADTQITEMGFVADPQFPATVSPYGRIEFLQIVGITAGELAEGKRWNLRGLLSALEPQMPLWVTDIHRASLHTLPAVKAAVDQGAGKDGSNTGVLYGSVLKLQSEKKLLRAEKVTVTMGALLVRDLLGLLPGRLPHDKDLSVAGDDFSLIFEPADAGCAFEWEDSQTLLVRFGPRELQAFLDTVKPRGADYVVPGLNHLIWRVEPSQIKDQDGRVQEVFGEPGDA
ncbi:suppressor of fused domain protein [Diaphorobacter sp. HDW4A]|uniref:suppressor of fused domain protein n=1 Tax=Diaphorobacter sp. HDW4A TaxID=2714924 RepID=UPI001408B8BE|nr:suppressor of fused domain protein [Diaphorobacter sp. HDW4A]QIL80299.1 suppressor of fused domain protein [Diaphorobacter sp. HDW4A]